MFGLILSDISGIRVVDDDALRPPRPDGLRPDRRKSRSAFSIASSRKREPWNPSQFPTRSSVVRETRASIEVTTKPEKASNEPAFAAIQVLPSPARSRMKKEWEKSYPSTMATRPANKPSRVGRLCPGKKARLTALQQLATKSGNARRSVDCRRSVVTSKSRPALKSEIWGSAAGRDRQKPPIFVLGSTLDQPSIAAISAGTARTLNHRTGQPWGARDES